MPPNRTTASGRESNEPLLREVNRRIYQLTRDFDGASEFLCECAHPTCEMTPVKMHPTEFADLLAGPGWLLIAPGHETPGLEIVRESRLYLIARESAPATSRSR